MLDEKKIERALAVALAAADLDEATAAVQAAFALGFRKGAKTSYDEGWNDQEIDTASAVETERLALQKHYQDLCDDYEGFCRKADAREAAAEQARQDYLKKADAAEAEARRYADLVAQQMYELGLTGKPRRRCHFCNAQLREDIRADANYCGDAHRKAAERQRKTVTAVTAAG